MGISAVSSTTLSTFGQLNQEVHAKGTQAAKEHSEEAAAYYKVSPFGNDTKIGTSPFQQSNAATVSIGEQKTAAIMDKAMSYMRVSNLARRLVWDIVNFSRLMSRLSAITRLGKMARPWGRVWI